MVDRRRRLRRGRIVLASPVSTYCDDARSPPVARRSGSRACGPRPARMIVGDLGERSRCAPMSTSDGICGGVPVQIVAVAGRRSAAGRAARPLPAAGVRRQAAGPREVVGVDVEQPGRRIERRAAPLRAAVEAGEDDRLLPTLKRHELAVAAERARTARAPTGAPPASALVSMSSVSSCRANGAGCVGNGCVSAATSPATLLAGNLRYSIGNSGLPVARSNRKTSRAWSSAPRRRSSGRSRRTVTRRRRRRKIAIPDVVPHDLEVPDALAGVGVEREQRSWRTGCRPRGWRRRNRPPPIRSARRRCRAPRRRAMPAQLLAPPL